MLERFSWRSTLLLLSCLGGVAWSPAAAAQEPPDPPRPYSRAHVLDYTVLSGALAVGGFALPVPAPYLYSSQLSASAPLLAVSTGDAASIAGLQAAFIGGSVSLTVAKDGDARYTPYWTTLEELSLHQALYATYATYRDFRVRAVPEYASGFRAESADALVMAPLHASNYLHPVVIVPLTIEAALIGLITAAYVGSNGFDGGPFARTAALGVLVSYDAGVTEEAFERGVVYEELKLSLPRWPARLVDAAFFSGLHVPGEIKDHWSSSQVTVGAVAHVLFSLLADGAYDEGGLRESIPLHVAFDTVIFVAAAAANQKPLGADALSFGRPGAPRPGSPAATTVPLVSVPF